jgi:hypothetical protein
MSLPALKLPGEKRTREIEIDEEDTISTSRFFPQIPKNYKDGISY